MTPDEAQEVADLVQRVRNLTHGQVLVMVVPSDWDLDQAARLSRAVGRAMRAGPAGLRAIERAVRG